MKKKLTPRLTAYIAAGVLAVIISIAGVTQLYYGNRAAPVVTATNDRSHTEQQTDNDIPAEHDETAEVSQKEDIIIEDTQEVPLSAEAPAQRAVVTTENTAVVIENQPTPTQQSESSKSTVKSSSRTSATSNSGNTGSSDSGGSGGSGGGNGSGGNGESSKDDTHSSTPENSSQPEPSQPESSNPVESSKPDESSEPSEPSQPEKPVDPNKPVEGGEESVKPDQSSIYSVYGVNYAVIALGKEFGDVDGYKYYLSGHETPYVSYSDALKSAVKIELPDRKTRTIEIRNEDDQRLVIVQFSANSNAKIVDEPIVDSSLVIKKYSPDIVIADRIMYTASYIKKVKDNNGNLMILPETLPRNATIPQGGFAGIMAASGGGGGGGSDPTPDPGADHTIYGYIAADFDMLANYNLQKELGTIRPTGRAMLTQFDNMAKIYGLNEDKNLYVPFAQLGSGAFYDIAKAFPDASNKYYAFPKYVKWINSDGSLLTKVNFATGEPDDFVNGPELALKDDLYFGRGMDINTSVENETWYYSIEKVSVISTDGQGKNFDITTRTKKTGELLLNVPFYFKGFMEHPGKYKLQIHSLDYPVIEKPFNVVTGDVYFNEEWDYLGNLLLKHYSWNFALGLEANPTIRFDGNELASNLYTVGKSSAGEPYSIKFDKSLFTDMEDHEISILVDGYAGARLIVCKEDESKLKAPPSVTIGKTASGDIQRFVFDIEGDLEWQKDIRSVVMISNPSNPVSNVSLIKFTDASTPGKLIVDVQGKLAANELTFEIKSKGYKLLSVKAQVVDTAPQVKTTWLSSGNLRIEEAEAYEYGFTAAIDKLYLDGTLVNPSKYKQELRYIILYSDVFTAGAEHTLRLETSSISSYDDAIITVKVPADHQPAKTPSTITNVHTRLYQDVYMDIPDFSQEWQDSITSMRVIMSDFREIDITNTAKFEDGVLHIPHLSDYNDVRRYNIIVEAKGYNEAYSYFEVVNVDPIYTLSQTSSGDIEISFSSSSTEVQYELNSIIDKLHLNDSLLNKGSQYVLSSNYLLKIFSPSFKTDGTYKVTFYPKKETDSAATALKFGIFDIEFEIVNGKLKELDKLPAPSDITTVWDDLDSFCIETAETDFIKNITSVRVNGLQISRAEKYATSTDLTTLYLLVTSFSKTNTNYTITVYSKGYETYTTTAHTPDEFKPVIIDAPDYVTQSWDTDGTLVFMYYDGNKYNNFCKRITGVDIDGIPVQLDSDNEYIGYKVIRNGTNQNEIRIAPRNWQEERPYEITIHATGYNPKTYKLQPPHEYVGLLVPPALTHELIFSGDSPEVQLNLPYDEPLWREGISIVDVNRTISSALGKLIEHAAHNTDRTTPGQISIRLEKSYSGGEYEIEISSLGYERLRKIVTIVKPAPTFKAIWVDNTDLRITHDGSNDNSGYFSALNIENITLNGQKILDTDYTRESNSSILINRSIVEQYKGSQIEIVFEIPKNKYTQNGTVTVTVPDDIGTALNTPAVKLPEEVVIGEDIDIIFDGASEDKDNYDSWKNAVVQTEIVRTSTINEHGFSTDSENLKLLWNEGYSYFATYNDYILRIYSNGYKALEIPVKFKNAKPDVYVTILENGNVEFRKISTATSFTGCTITINGKALTTGTYTATSNYLNINASVFETTSEYYSADHKYELGINFPASSSYASYTLQFEKAPNAALLTAPAIQSAQSINKEGSGAFITLVSDDATFRDAVEYIDIMASPTSTSWTRITDIDTSQAGELSFALPSDFPAKEYSVRIAASGYKLTIGKMRILKDAPNFTTTWKNRETLIVNHDSANSNSYYFNYIATITLNGTALTKGTDYTVDSATQITLSKELFAKDTSYTLEISLAENQYVADTKVEFSSDASYGDIKDAPTVQTVGETVLYEDILLSFAGERAEEWADSITTINILESSYSGNKIYEYISVATIDKENGTITLPKNAAFNRTYSYNIEIIAENFRDTSLAVTLRYAVPATTVTRQYDGSVLIATSGTTNLNGLGELLVNDKNILTDSTLFTRTKSNITISSAVFDTSSAYYADDHNYVISFVFPTTGTYAAYASFNVTTQQTPPEALAAVPSIETAEIFNLNGDTVSLSVQPEDAAWLSGISSIQIQNTSMIWTDVTDYTVDGETLSFKLQYNYTAGSNYGIKIYSDGYELYQSTMRIIKRAPLFTTTWPDLERLAIRQDTSNSNNYYFNYIDKVLLDGTEIASTLYAPAETGKILNIDKAAFTPGEDCEITVIMKNTAYVQDGTITVTVPENLGGALTAPDVEVSSTLVKGEDIVLSLGSSGQTQALEEWTDSITTVTVEYSTTIYQISEKGSVYVSDDENSLVIPWREYSNLNTYSTYTLRISAIGYKDLTFPVRFSNATKTFDVQEESALQLPPEPESSEESVPQPESSIDPLPEEQPDTSSLPDEANADIPEPVEASESSTITSEAEVKQETAESSNQEQDTESEPETETEIESESVSSQTGEDQ